MLDAIESLQEGLKKVEESRSIFHNEMRESDKVGDNQKANVCEDAVDSLDVIIRDLKKKIDYLSNSALVIQRRKRR